MQIVILSQFFQALFPQFAVFPKRFKERTLNLVFLLVKQKSFVHAENERTGRQITSDWILNTRFKFCFLRSLREEELFFLRAYFAQRVVEFCSSSWLS